MANQQAIPRLFRRGFALRLMKAEILAVEAVRPSLGELTWAVARVPTDFAGQALVAFFSGTQRLFARAREPHARPVGSAGDTPVSTSWPLNPVRVTDLRRETRVVYGCLRLFDLAACRTARNVDELAAALDVSRGTVVNDLRCLEAAGLRIEFPRRRRRALQVVKAPWRIAQGCRSACLRVAAA